jgi:imidazoleglycerol phosphate synthase cyclase subunit
MRHGPRSQWCGRNCAARHYGDEREPRTLLDAVRSTARSLFVPFTVGGGIRQLDDAAAVFDAGADKIAINSAAVRDPTLIGKIAGRFGSQAVVVAIDARKTDGNFEVFVAGGRMPTGRDAIQWAREAAACGAGEILLTSMDRDGTNPALTATRARRGRSGFDSGHCLGRRRISARLHRSISRWLR